MLKDTRIGFFMALVSGLVLIGTMRPFLLTATPSDANITHFIQLSSIHVAISHDCQPNVALGRPEEIFEVPKSEKGATSKKTHQTPFAEMLNRIVTYTYGGQQAFRLQSTIQTQNTSHLFLKVLRI
jgi:hypothetical protein